MSFLKHSEAFPSDWPVPASEQFKLLYTTDPKYRKSAQTMRELFACSEGGAYSFQKLPVLADWRYMATWFYQRQKSFERAPGLPSDSFNEWPNIFLHIGPRPSAKYSIHRIDDTLNYAEGNLAWATRKIQAVERRDKRKVKFRGRNLTYEQLSSELYLAGVHKSQDAIKSFLKRNRPKFKTDTALHDHMFRAWGIDDAAHAHDPGPLKTSDFLPGYKNQVWWEREKEKAGPGMTRLEFQERHLRRLLADASNKQHRFAYWQQGYKDLQRLIDDLNRHYKAFLKGQEDLKKQDAAAFIAKYASAGTDPGYNLPKVSGF